MRGAGAAAVAPVVEKTTARRRSASLDLVVVVYQERARIRLVRPPEAFRDVSRSHLPVEHVLDERAVARQRLVHDVPHSDPVPEVPHRREDVPPHGGADLVGTHVLEERRRRDVPHQHVTLDVQVARYRPVDHRVDVSEIVPAERRLRGRPLRYRAREGVDEGGPLEVMLDDDRVEFRREYAGVPRGGSSGISNRGGGSIRHRIPPSFHYFVGIDGGDGRAADSRRSDCCHCCVIAVVFFFVIVEVRDEERTGQDRGADVHLPAALGRGLAKGGGGRRHNMVRVYYYYSASEFLEN